MAPSASWNKDPGTELPTNMCKAWAVKDVVPLIAYCMCIAQCAPAQLPGDHWPDKPALLNRQGMGAHSKLHQQPHSGKRHGNVKIRLNTQPAWAQGTMQSMCTAWLPWTEPASGTHADHPRLCGAAPARLPENPMNSRQQPQKMKMGKACPNRHTASRCLQPNCHT